MVMLTVFPVSSAGKESTCNAGDLGPILGLGRSPGEGKDYPLLVFWPGEFHGVYSPWGRKESDTTERLLPALAQVRRVVSWSGLIAFPPRGQS